MMKNISKSNFYKNRKPFIIDGVIINKILIPKKEPYGKKISLKYFTGYNDDDDDDDDDDVNGRLCVKLSQMIGYFKYFDSNKTTFFKASDNKLLKRYTKIWETVSNLMNIKFDSELVYGDNDKYIKTKIRTY